MAAAIPILLLTSLFALPAPGPDDNGHPVITVDANKPLGAMPYLFRNGEALNVKPLGYPMDKFFADHKPGSFYVMSWGFDHYLKSGKSIEGLRGHARDQTTGWDNNIAWMKNASDHGGEIILILQTSYWLGSEGDGLPPGNLDDWERFVYDTVDLFSNQMKLNISYQVWDEPDTEMFRGTLPQYFETIRRTVIGMKKANPNARFGGPGSSAFHGRGFRAPPAEEPLIYNFIKYCSQTPLPEVGLAKIPIDSVGWHVFDAEPYTAVFKTQASRVRAWLGEFGYDEHTQLNISSWTRWTGLNESEFNGAFLASYVLPMVNAMDEAGIQRQVYFDPFDHWLEEANLNPGKEFFEGGYGLYSRHFVTKAAYNAFEAMGRVAGDRLQVTASDPYVAALAASHGKRIAILLSNYMPKNFWPYLVDNASFVQTRSLQAFLSRVRTVQSASGQSLRDSVAAVLQTVQDPQLKQAIQQVLSLRQRLSDGSGVTMEQVLSELQSRITDEGLREDVNRIVALYKEVKRRKEQPIQVTVELNGLPDGRIMKYQHYVIDATHSNAYAIKDTIQDVADSVRGTTDVQQAVNALRAINDSPEVRLNILNQGSARAGGSMSKDITMAPYSVHLVVLEVPR